MSNKNLTAFIYKGGIFAPNSNLKHMKKYLKQKCMFGKLIQIKHAIITGVLLMCLQTAQINAQVAFGIVNPNETTKKEPIDDVQFTVLYETKMVTDTLKPEKTISESMILKVGVVSSSYYSYTRSVTDSILSEQLKKSGNIRVDNNAENFGIISYQIYKNYPTGKVTTLDKVAMNRFRCEEENEIPAWELLPDTATILYYTCQKAVCHFKGRYYEAWFAPEIPRHEGPWKLHGLPGLILKASDSQGHYTFECTGLTSADEKLMFGADGYESISRKNLDRIYERYAADPVGYMTSSTPNIKVVVRDESGENKSVKNIPYNPIERTD